MQVSIFEASSDKCFPRQLIRFAKKHVSLRDDGIVILSGYWIVNSIKQYCSIYLRVNSHPWPRYYVWVSVLVAVVTIVIIVVIAFVCKRYCKGKPYTFHGYIVLLIKSYLLVCKLYRTSWEQI
jgi:hypothetical protein